MISVVGIGLTAFGTVLAIVHPTIGARRKRAETDRRERRVQVRYYRRRGRRPDLAGRQRL